MSQVFLKWTAHKSHVWVFSPCLMFKDIAWFCWTLAVDLIKCVSLNVSSMWWSLKPGRADSEMSLPKSQSTILLHTAILWFLLYHLHCHSNSSFLLPSILPSSLFFLTSLFRPFFVNWATCLISGCVCRPLSCLCRVNVKAVPLNVTVKWRISSFGLKTWKWLTALGLHSFPCCGQRWCEEKESKELL